MTEQTRIRRNQSGERPAGLGALLVVTCRGDADACRNRTIEVMAVLAEAGAGTWPSDDEWRRLLPAWFVEATHGRTPSLDRRGPCPLDAWLDVMRNRGWAWWSSTRPEADEWRCYIECYEQPYAYDPLENLLYVSGADDVELIEDSRLW